MNLRTFGAVLTFALEQEDQAIVFLERLLEREVCYSIKPSLEVILRAKKKHRKIIETARRENVTEMILEPIQGLDSAGYQYAIPEQKADSLAKGLRISSGMEQCACNFYLEASQRIKLKEVARTFRKLYREKMEIVQNIKRLIPD